MKHAVQVTILGQQYTLKSDAPPEEVAKVVAFVNEKLSEVAASGRVVDSLNVAVLALLNVGASYIQLLDEKPSADGHLEARLRQLLLRLEQVCPSMDQPVHAERRRDGNSGLCTEILDR